VTPASIGTPTTAMSWRGTSPIRGSLANVVNPA
jgi:hypothetical protein